MAYTIHTVLLYFKFKVSNALLTVSKCLKTVYIIFLGCAVHIYTVDQLIRCFSSNSLAVRPNLFDGIA